MAVPENQYIVLPEATLKKRDEDRTFEILRRWLVQCPPRQQKLLESGEGINTRILLDGIDKDSDRAHLVLEVTAIRFNESVALPQKS